MTPVRRGEPRAPTAWHKRWAHGIQVAAPAPDAADEAALRVRRGAVAADGRAGAGAVACLLADTTPARARTPVRADRRRHLTRTAGFRHTDRDTHPARHIPVRRVPGTTDTRTPLRPGTGAPA
ncbi:hypothetical protein GCM10017687_13500 [Streptomyces echinatus]